MHFYNAGIRQIIEALGGRPENAWKGTRSYYTTAIFPLSVRWSFTSFHLRVTSQVARLMSGYGPHGFRIQGWLSHNLYPAPPCDTSEKSSPIHKKHSN